MEQQQNQIEFSLKSIVENLGDTDIQEDGRFKYVLIKGKYKDTTQYFVRGYARCPYHADVFAVFQEQLKSLNYFDQVMDLGDTLCCKKGEEKMNFTCTGGGRIEHSPENKKIFVFGYSQGFGLAKHSESVALIKNKFSEYPEANITWSNEGY